MALQDRIADLSDVWQAAGTVFPYFHRCGVDWDRRYYDFIPRAVECESEGEMNLLLAEFIAALGDGHTDYSLPRGVVLPFGFLYINGGYYIRETAPEGIDTMLSKVMGINGRDFDGWLLECFKYIYHVGSYASSGRLRSVLARLLPEKGNVLNTDRGDFAFGLGEAPTERASFGCGEFEKIEGRLDMRMYGDTLYIKLDDFLYAGAAEEVERAMENGPKQVILDIRENIGGMTMHAAKVAELFIPGEFGAFQKWTRSTSGIDYACASQYAGMTEEELASCGDEDGSVARCMRNMGRVNFEEYTVSYGKQGQEAKFDGELKILTSRDTVSAAEDFLAMFKMSGRGTIIGTPTAGTTGTPLLLRTRCGGWARVCSVGHRLSDGTEFIGQGIEPEIYMEYDPESLRAGRDNVLEYAMKK